MLLQDRRLRLSALISTIRNCLQLHRCVILEQMISAESVTTFIRQIFPDAAVTVIDKTGTQDHLIVRVTSDGFVDKNLLDRHRMVYQALAVPMKDGRIHALEISARTKAEAEE